jgi:hypothetical protein
MLTIRRRRSTSLRHHRRKKQRKQKGPEAAAWLPVVHACHQVQALASEVGSREGLSIDGRGVCGGSGAFEAAGR